MHQTFIESKVMSFTFLFSTYQRKLKGIFPEAPVIKTENDKNLVPGPYVKIQWLIPIILIPRPETDAMGKFIRQAREIPNTIFMTIVVMTLKKK